MLDIRLKSDGMFPLLCIIFKSFRRYVLTYGQLHFFSQYGQILSAPIAFEFLDSLSANSISMSVKSFKSS